MIDRIFNVLSNVPPLTKGFYMGQVLSGTLGRFFDVFLQQMSRTLHSKALERLVRKIVSEFHPSAQRYIGAIVDSVVFSAPSEALRLIVPALCGKILINGAVNSSESEALYCLHLLGHALKRAGPHSQPYAAQIEEVLSAVCVHKEKKYHKEGHKCLRKYLRSGVRSGRDPGLRTWFPSICAIASAYVCMRMCRVFEATGDKTLVFDCTLLPAVGMKMRIK